MLRSKHSIMRKSTEFVKNALAFFWRFSGCVWHFFGAFLTSFGIFSDFQSGNPVYNHHQGFQSGEVWGEIVIKVEEFV